MAKGATKAAKEADSLPANTNVENIINFIDALKRKNCVEEEVRKVFGMGSTAFSNTKSAIRTFGLIEENSCKFTDFGREVAYSKDGDKKEPLQNIVSMFSPYESLLINVLEKNPSTETTVEDMTNFWGKLKCGSSQSNMESAATLFMSILDYLEYGKYVVGRLGRPTRIVWNEDARQKFQEAVSKLEKSVDEQIEVTVAEAIEEQPQIVVQQTSDEDHSDKPVQIIERQSTFKGIGPNITISVDMSTWPEEKIESFFKYAYGIFKEEK